MSCTSMLPLRILATTSATCTLLFNCSREPQPVFVACAWGLLLVTVNVYSLYKYLQTDNVEISPREYAVYERCFLPFGISPKEFLDVIQRAQPIWLKVSKGYKFCTTGDRGTKMWLVLDGQMKVRFENGSELVAPPVTQACAKGSIEPFWMGSVKFMHEFVTEQSETIQTTSREEEQQEEEFEGGHCALPVDQMTRPWVWDRSWIAETDVTVLEFDRLKVNEIMEERPEIRAKAAMMNINDLHKKVMYFTNESKRSRLESYSKLLQVVLSSESGIQVFFVPSRCWSCLPMISSTAR